MAMNFHGNTALITGAARGLGLSIVEDLAREGVDNCGTDVRLELLQSEMTRIANEYGIKTLAIKTDVGIKKQVKELVRQILHK